MADRTENFITGLFIGGVIGAAVGILFAPKSGKELREDIEGKTDELLAKAKEEYQEALEKSKKAYEAAIDRLNELESVAAEKVEELGAKAAAKLKKEGQDQEQNES